MIISNSWLLGLEVQVCHFAFDEFSKIGFMKILILFELGRNKTFCTFKTCQNIEKVLCS